MPILVPDDDATSWIRLPFLRSSKYSKLAQDEHEFSPTTTTTTKLKRRLNIPWEQWAVLILSVVLFAVSITLFKKTIKTSLEVDKFTEDGHLRPQAFWPYVPAVDVRFEDFPEYRATDGAGSQVWKDLMPTGGGYVEVLDPRQYDMPASVPLDTEGQMQEVEVYSTSVTHQLRCLARLRAALIAQSDRPAGEQPASEIWHCFDYLRQGILCAGDTTLEAGKASYADDGTLKEAVFDGAGTIHQCRSWPVIKEAMASRRASNLSFTIVDA